MATRYKSFMNDDQEKIKNYIEYKLRDLALTLNSPLIIYSDKDENCNQRILDFLYNLYKENSQVELVSQLDRSSLFLASLHDNKEFLQSLFPNDH